MTKNVIGKHYYLRVWEDDIIGEHDLLYERVHKITNDKQLVTFVLTKDRQQIGEIGNDPKNPDSGEYRAEWTDHQELFAEIALADISKESTRLTVEVLEEYKSPEYKSTAKVKMLPKKENKGIYICQEQYKDLVWGGKVSCDFRKKVIEICTELWTAKPMEMANGSMAVMKVETDGSLKAHQIIGKTLQDVNSLTKDDFYLTKKDGSKTSRAIGLIQFTQAALELVGDFVGGSAFNKLHQVKLNYAKMGEIRQLEKVKKYFSLQPKYNKLKILPKIYIYWFSDRKELVKMIAQYYIEKILMQKNIDKTKVLI